MRTIIILFALLLFGCQGSDQNFNEVKIGNQVWMSENLNVDKFRNGDTIPRAISAEEWEYAGINKRPAWCFYDDELSHGAKYGKLYNWYAVNDPRGLAPFGYHIPTDEEWSTVTDFLGGRSVAGKKMKSENGWSIYSFGQSKMCTNCETWSDEYRRKVACHNCKDTRFSQDTTLRRSGNGSNSSGFLGLPGGVRDGNGVYYDIGSHGGWWSISEYDSEIVWIRYLRSNSSDFERSSAYAKVGLSVRCIKD